MRQLLKATISFFNNLIINVVILYTVLFSKSLYNNLIIVVQIITDATDSR